MSKVSVTKTNKPLCMEWEDSQMLKKSISLPCNLATHWLCLMTTGKTLAVVAGVYQDQDLLDFFFF